MRLCGDGRRLVPTSVSVAVARQASGGLGPLDVVVVSGGARGVTAASVVELARRSRSRFALLGRTVPATDPDWAHGIAGDAALKKAALQAARDVGRTPSPRELAHEVAAVESRRELQSTLHAIREAGAEASYFALDVRDTAAVERALSEVRERFGPVTALVHGAGVICDRHLADASLEEFDRVFDTKVTGLRNLLGETAADPVRRLCLFSSLSAFSGNVGQGAYAMANEVLNRIAEAESERRGAACRVRSIGWGPWDSGMVNPALRAQFEDRGVPLITLERGAEALADEFDGAPGGPAELLILAGGGALHPTGLQGCLRASVALGAATHAWLADHAVAAAPVVPLALVLDWFARAVRWVAPACEAVRLHDLRVLRGIELAAFDVHPECFCIELEVEPAGLTTRLCDADGTVRYRAGAEIVPAGALAAQAPSPEALLPVPDDGSGKTLYEEVLFHGPRFQALASQVDLNSAGGRARIVGLRELDWPRQSWFTDPAAIDAGLQIAVVWDAGERGLRTLPMGVDEALVLRTGPLAGPADCVQDGHAHNASASRSDLVYRDADGRPFALLRGVRTFAVGPAADAEPPMEATDTLALTAK